MGLEPSVSNRGLPDFVSRASLLPNCGTREGREEQRVTERVCLTGRLSH